MLIVLFFNSLISCNKITDPTKTNSNDTTKIVLLDTIVSIKLRIDSSVVKETGDTLPNACKTQRVYSFYLDTLWSKGHSGTFKIKDSVKCLENNCNCLFVSNVFNGIFYSKDGINWKQTNISTSGYIIPFIHLQ